jgi:hypothetical protein
MENVMSLRCERYRKLVESPGKFEGESIVTPYFYDEMMNGNFGDSLFADSDGARIDFYVVTPRDVVMLDSGDDTEDSPLRGIYGVRITYHQDGSVTSSVFATKEQYREAEAEAEERGRLTFRISTAFSITRANLSHLRESVNGTAVDADCTINPQSHCCTVCAVYHGDPCEICGGAAYHYQDCPEWAE